MRSQTKAMEECTMEECTPQWVREMHAFRHEHGFYRPEDVIRVLGDPGKRVEVPVIDYLAAAQIKV
jgi:hypothetical protein